MLEKLKKISEENKGLIFTKDVTNAGIRREKLREYVESGRLIRVKRGVYCFSDEMVDEYFLLQLRAPGLIYSLGTALYFHGYSNRVPNIISITVVQGYNTHRIADKKIRVRYSKADIFEIGLSSITTPQGSEVRCYNLERTICDIVKERTKIDPQIFSDAMNQYFGNKRINSKRLMEYAKELGIEEDIIKYLEVLR